MAEEKDEFILKSTLWLQQQQESLVDDGFTVTYNEQDYVFYPKFLDYNDKKMDRLLSGFFIKQFWEPNIWPDKR